MHLVLEIRLNYNLIALKFVVFTSHFVFAFILKEYYLSDFGFLGLNPIINLNNPEIVLEQID